LIENALSHIHINGAQEKHSGKEKESWSVNWKKKREAQARRKGSGGRRISQNTGHAAQDQDKTEIIAKRGRATGSINIL